MKDVSPNLRLPMRRGSVEYTTGGEADHESVYQTLLHVFHGSDRESFLGTLSDPDYRPDQRLLVKVDGKVASHVHLTDRAIRYGQASLHLNGVMWVGTLPEYLGLGFAQNPIRLADQRAQETGAVLQAISTGMPQFFRALGWGVCGRQSLGTSLSRNLPADAEGVQDGKTVAWTVRPWRQVELGDLMTHYQAQYGQTTGTVVRNEDYWRWIIGRRYAHVIWVACQADAVRGYAFVKDHRVLELAYDPAHPQAMRALLARVRAEALERAYPEVIVHAPAGHPILEEVRRGSGRILDLEEHEGSTSMYHVPDPGRFLKAILPELMHRVRASGATQPVELGLTVGDRRWLVQVGDKQARVEADKLGRRHLNLTPAAFTRLVMGHTGIETAIVEDGVEASTQTALDSAAILFPVQPIWRSPLDCATA